MCVTPYRAALVDIERHYRGREIARVPVRMTYADPFANTAGFGRHLSPFIDPCRRGHTPTTQGAWVVCAVCGTPLYKAGK